MSSTSPSSTPITPVALQENAITWELIAEASKGETPAVHAMILKRFDQLYAEDIANAANTNTASPTATAAGSSIAIETGP